MAWNSIPVLAYHQVRPGGLVTPEGFGAHLAVMRDGGWQTCFLDEVVAFVRGERTPSARTVAITFDDGYLDNWVHAFPLLTKHNAKATVFVITARPHDGSPRPKAADCPPLDEAQRDAVRAGGPSAHFCNWQELKAMADSGLVQVQSHGHEHRACFAEPTVLRLNRGRESWALPTMTDGDERGGIPVYPWRSALAACRYADSPELRDEAVRRLSEGQSEAEIVADLNRRLLTDALGRSETPA
ncbi:MAG: hypothetical protein FJ279_38755, partial [Planctomycetes bacterium]|nr:hypothetical protein [Planctomycetota bacterium]